jgi:hypothetical protein
MSDDLATYLHDHQAGAVVALDVMAQLESAYADSEIASIVATLRREVEADRDTLDALVSSLGIGKDSVRKAAGWMAAQATALKLRADGGEHGPLRLLESAELLSLGIEGKRILWLAMQACTDGVPQLRALDFATLIARAEAQRHTAETLRLGAARACFVAS